MFTPRILIAETSAIVLDIEKKCLEESGALLFTAGDCEETVRGARKFKPWLIYLAYNLSGGGDECCRALKSDPVLQAIPVVMVCAPSGDEPRLSRAAGCDAIVAKPIDRRDFLEMGLSLLSPAEPETERTICRTIVVCSDGEETFYGSIEDISSSGMFVSSARGVMAGDRLALMFILPWARAVPVKANAQVSWVNSSKRRRTDRLPVGFGVHFLEPEEATVSQIKDYLEFMQLRLGG
jgi:CheY-like chemotaxis protein